MELVKGANIALRFLLELAAVAALGYWGAHVGTMLPLKLLLGLGAPLLLVLVWGTFAAPRATVTLPAPAPFLLRLALLILAGGALALAGRATWGMAYTALAVVNAALLAVWRQ